MSEALRSAVVDVAPPAGSGARPRVRVAGKFLAVGDEKLYVKGVTYGTFRPDERGHEFHARVRVAHDFDLMAQHGINAVRTYTVPPRWLLDLAAERGLYVLVGIPWEQHVAFLDDRGRAQAIEQRVRDHVRSLAGHPALLAYAVGNEIPAPIVRWQGRSRVERFLERLHRAAKDADPGGLITYVNYPSTEYLELPFLDLYAFNVYLEEREQLGRYLARIQHLAGDRPLLLTELGLDSRRNGLEGQAQSLEWQIRSTFAAGAAGTFVFAWTDEWHRGGHDIEDWDFGLTDRDRRPKPALDAVSRAYPEMPFGEREWPRVSVVVCSCNGSRTIRRTCEGLLGLDYPDLEVIVVDDGSRDATGSIAEESGFRVIRTENRGLSAARNTGLEAASGEYVVYLDDDAWPDPHWLKYLVHTFESGAYAAAGGPNIPPPDDSRTAQCVARSPGGPIHVLIDDLRAEHLPGCNLAVRRSVLADMDGFDARFRVAGDDVDLCWRLLGQGLEIGFAPGAMVWHRRRETVRGYLRQQRGYGRAEALLERKWPEKYNVGGHRTWAGRIYGPGAAPAIWSRSRVYYGSWGTGLFQRLYHPVPGIVRSLPLTPEWWLILLFLSGLSLLAVVWAPLLVALAALLVALGVTVGEAILSARRGWVGERASLRWRLLTASMYVLQPLARLIGRIGYGLRPWWRQASAGIAAPMPRTVAIWSEEWRSAEEWLQSVRDAMVSRGVCPVRGGNFDRWDLGVRSGLLGGARLRHAIEEHGAGRQLVRFRIVPRLSAVAIVAPFLFLGPHLIAVLGGAWIAAAALGAAALVVVLVALREAAAGTALALHAVGGPRGSDVARAPAEKPELVVRAPEETGTTPP
jgi:GT2 family glycosyltransferase